MFANIILVKQQQTEQKIFNLSSFPISRILSLSLPPTVHILVQSSMFYNLLMLSDKESPIWLLIVLLKMILFALKTVPHYIPLKCALIRKQEYQNSLPNTSCPSFYNLHTHILSPYLSPSLLPSGRSCLLANINIMASFISLSFMMR